jgi:hypothetical protein
MKKALILVGILAVVASLGIAGCSCGNVEKDPAKSMISDAKAAGAANDSAAQAKLKSAESSMASADKAEKKFKCKDAKADYIKAYNDAKDAWKTTLTNKPAANCPCK